MSSSTALLPKDRKKEDHPIFLRVCHSPWLSINQKSLVFLRVIIAAYLFVSALMVLHYELKVNEHGWLTIYSFSNIVYGLQAIYAIVTATWTFMHLYYPHHDNSSNSLSTWCEKFLSPPRHNNNTKNKYFFSLFHFVITTFPHIVTFIHWVILVPKGHSTIPGDEGFNHGWFRAFYVCTKYGINSIIALFEVFFLSSIKRPDPVYHHVAGIFVLLLVYVGWAGVGHCVTDKYSYYFLNHVKMGWEYYWTSVAGFVVLGELFFVFVYALTGVRESLTKKQNEDKNTGYQRLPQ